MQCAFAGDIDPAIYEQAALGIRTQAQAQAEAQGTTLSAMLVDQKISLEQYERMTALQASDMVNQGLALDAWARHYGIEPERGRRHGDDRKYGTRS